MSFWKDLWSGSLPSQNTGREESSGTKPSPPSTPPPLPTAVRPRAKNTAHQQRSRTKPSPASTAPPSPTAGRARAKYEEGMRLRDSDDVEDKRAALKAFMDAAEDPQCVEASVEVAKFFYNLDAKKHKDVWRPYATRAFTADSTNKDAKYLMAAGCVLDALRHSDAKHWTEAYDAYKRAFELHPEDESVFSTLEVVSRKADRGGDFADLCDDWLEEHPDDHPKRLSQGIASFRLALDSNNPAPGQEWIQPEFFRRARAAFTTYIRHLPDCPKGHFHLAKVYLSTREPDSAREELAILSRLDAKMATELRGYFEHLGITTGESEIRSGAPLNAESTEMNRRSRAKTKYEEGMRLVDSGKPDPDGYEFVDADDLNKGLRIIEEASRIDPSFIDPPLTLAGLYHRMDPKKYCERILSLADAAMALDATNPETKQMASLAYFTKAQALMEKKDWKAAASYFRRAHELDPFDAQALSVYRLAAVEAGEHEAFVNACETYLKDHPDDHQVRYTVARALLNWALKVPTAPDAAWLKDRLLEQAEGQLKRFLLSDPLQPDANFWLANALAARRHYDEARQIVAKLSDIDPARAKQLDEQLKEAPRTIKSMEYSAEISAALSRAKGNARDSRQTEFHNEHFIMALLAIDGDFRKTLARTNIDMQLLETRVRGIVDKYPRNDAPSEVDTGFGEDLVKTLEQAEWYRTQLGGDRVGAQHYFLSFVNEKGALSEYIDGFIKQAVSESKSENKE